MKNFFTFPIPLQSPIIAARMSKMLVSAIPFARIKSFLHHTNISLDAQIAGRIIVDMTFLREEGIIKPVYPEEGNNGTEHYRVEYELVAIVEGRALRYEARYPAGEGGEVLGKGQFSIAAAFREGTA